jgi:formylglycine-generating enzyme required for sulfatase activity/ABC-type phosphate transport system substrate-binding protein
MNKTFDLTLIALALCAALAHAETGRTPPDAGSDFRLAGLDLAMRWIASSESQLGSPSAEPSRGTDEGPVTIVRHTRGFWIGKTEVTQRQWWAVMGTRPSRFVGDDLPVEQVSWIDAMEFAARLTRRERDAGRLPQGYAYSLPTEAQWEYAARGSATGILSESVDDQAWHDQNSDGRTRPVASKRANAFDLNDMLGNVWEWCLDWYGQYPGGKVVDFSGPASGEARSSRGGSWWAGPRGARPANRYRDAPNNRNDDLGFRLALIPSSTPLPLALAGTDSMANLIGSWTQLYSQRVADARTTIRAGEPPIAAEGLATAAADIGFTGRALRPAEIAAVLAGRSVAPRSIIVGGGAYADPSRTHTMAVFVRANHPLRRLTIEQLRAIMSGTTPPRTWDALGLGGLWSKRHIRPLVAKLGTGATDFVREHALSGDVWAADVREFATDQQAIDALAEDELAICVAGLPFRDERVRALEIATHRDGPFYAPTRQNIAARHYPLARLLYLHWVPSDAPEVQVAIATFLRTALNSDGQAAVDTAGYMSLPWSWRSRELMQLP